MQDIPNTWLRFDYTHNRAAVVAGIEYLAGDSYTKSKATSDRVNAVGKALNHALTTLEMEALSSSPTHDFVAWEDWLREQDQGIYETLVLEHLPRGPDDASVSEGSIEQVNRILRRLDPPIEPSVEI